MVPVEVSNTERHLGLGEAERLRTRADTWKPQGAWAGRAEVGFRQELPEEKEPQEEHIV